MNEQPWIGHFLGYNHKRFDFGMTSHGKMSLQPKDNRGNNISMILALPIQVVIEETLPNGKITARQVQEATLTSPDPMSPDFEKATIRGQVTGGAEFELKVEQMRGVIQIGGRLVSPGTLTKNPIRFAVRTNFPSAYRHSPKEGKEGKEFLKRIEDDRLDVKWTDGKRKKLTFDKQVDAGSDEVNGPGISSAELEMSAYRDRKFEFAATGSSVLKLSSPEPRPLHEGYTMTWIPNSEKDPEGKDRFTIEVR